MTQPSTIGELIVTALDGDMLAKLLPAKSWAVLLLSLPVIRLATATE